MKKCENCLFNKCSSLPYSINYFTLPLYLSCKTYLRTILHQVNHPFVIVDSHAQLMMLSLLDNRPMSPINHVLPSKIDPNNLIINLVHYSKWQIQMQSLNQFKSPKTDEQKKRMSKTISCVWSVIAYLVIERWLFDDCQFYCLEYPTQILHQILNQRQVLLTQWHHHQLPQIIDPVLQCTFPFQHHLYDKYNPLDWIPIFVTHKWVCVRWIDVPVMCLCMYKKEKTEKKRNHLDIEIIKSHTKKIMLVKKKTSEMPRKHLLQQTNKQICQRECEARAICIDRRKKKTHIKPLRYVPCYNK